MPGKAIMLKPARIVLTRKKIDMCLRRDLRKSRYSDLAIQSWPDSGELFTVPYGIANPQRLKMDPACHIQAAPEPRNCYGPQQKGNHNNNAPHNIIPR